MRSSPLEYLDLLVVDANGVVVSDSISGDFFSPLEEAYTFRLQPGEKLARPASLQENVPEAKPLPGQDKVHVVFEYHGFQAVSEPLHFQWSGEEWLA